MKNLIFIAFLFLTLCPLSFGQNLNCPTISVTGPSSSVQPGETMTFTANVGESDIDLNKLTYQWSVDKGTIIEGQGTPTIIVSTEGLVDATITAIVKVEGLANGCKNLVSEAAGVVIVGCGLPLIFDDFGKLSKNDEKARLDALAGDLMVKKEFIAYIILYHPANKKSYESKVARIKNHLIRVRGVPSEQIVFISGGIEPEERARIYLIPKGLEPPTP